ncbi:MAG: GYD domain-containing protein [Thermoanaerobaculum sp.]|nr:GYD domain-containing protein [Thermoanaerobaculum sp.]MCX7896142.1 GYD domain-containing protein [Thermoanaerobaculum sp.]MDW7967863.1 GYD domain-containing protein [Thermoanaerobaculum sp.]
MPTFILLTKLAPESSQSAQSRKAMGKEWLQRVKAACPGVKFLAHYAILGPYDFMDIYEAPDAETAHKVSLISRAGGAVSVESWQAVPYERFLQLLGEVQPES